MMGFFFWLNSVALIEDLPLKEEAYDSVKELRNDIEGGYQQVRLQRRGDKNTGMISIHATSLHWRRDFGIVVQSMLSMASRIRAILFARSEVL